MIATEIPLPTKQTLPNPEPVQQLPVTWIVLTPKTPPSGDYVWIAISPRDYENLSRNEADIIRWIKEAGFRLEYYGETQ